MSKNLIAIAAALSLAAFLPACQSSGSSDGEIKEVSTPTAGRCEKAKRAGNRNTPVGQASIAVHCSSKGLSRDQFTRVWWSTHARHQECVDKTGRICPS
jgi:hypothetical protein